MKRLLLLCSVALVLAAQKPSAAEPQIFKAQVSSVPTDPLAGQTDWVRLEANGRSVKVIHTTAVIRVVIVPYTSWIDHSVVATVFRPDGCRDLLDGNLGAGERLAALETAVARKLVDEQEARELRATIQKQVDGAGTLQCLVVGSDTLELPEGIDPRKGTWTIQYQLNPGSRPLLTFRLPLNPDANAETEVLTNRAQKSQH